MQNNQKIIGTLVPLTALFSTTQERHDYGTFATGVIFLDWIKKTQQSAWQLLPLHETQLEFGSTSKHVPSPYKSYGIGLAPHYLSHQFKQLHATEEEKKDFIEQNKEWLPDYALFCALRDRFGTDDWRTWEQKIRNRDEEAIASWTKQLRKEIAACIELQWQLAQSYDELRKKAKKLHISLIGDLPFYLSIQSPLVWANQDIFEISSDGKMRFVSGIPDTPLAHFGRQVWGHPLYKWGNTEQQKKVVKFWKMRLRYVARLFDVIRFDHAKAFFEYGVIDSEQKESDVYKKGPGAEVFEELVFFSHKNGLLLFAEDAGEKLHDLRLSLKKIKIPGIKVFRFSLEEKKGKINKEYVELANYPENTVAYTTTHDTETLSAYLENLTPEQKQKLAIISQVPYEGEDLEFVKKLRQAILSSPARTVIVPIQDWLLSTDRINIPGTELPVNDPNWQFRLKAPIEELPETLI